MRSKRSSSVFGDSESHPFGGIEAMRKRDTGWIDAFSCFVVRGERVDLEPRGVGDGPYGTTNVLKAFVSLCEKTRKRRRKSRRRDKFPRLAVVPKDHIRIFSAPKHCSAIFEGDA